MNFRNKLPELSFPVETNQLTRLGLKQSFCAPGVTGAVLKLPVLEKSQSLSSRAQEMGILVTLASLTGSFVADFSRAQNLSALG